ncbi:MAG: glycosyltransferase [Myxococcaceae bacterium]|nr:glycosyltransferase [Myxococcaceae bacterium]
MTSAPNATRQRWFSRQISTFLNSVVPAGSRVLLAGCREANVVEALGDCEGVALVEPGTALLLDASRAPRWRVEVQDLKTYAPGRKFDYVILDDYLTYEDRLHDVLERLGEMLAADGQASVLAVNPSMLWGLRVARFLGLATPSIERNILALEDLTNLAGISGFELIDSGFRFAVPWGLLGAGQTLNAVVPRLPVLERFCFGQYMVVRPAQAQSQRTPMSCSVVVPCFNEEGNVRECIERIPNFGTWREIIVVDDGSKDRTAEIVRDVMKGRDDIRLISYHPNRGKGYAVSEGWKAAKGDVLMMLDCDATTPPEELPIFHDAMERGAEFINGTRVVYPREKDSIPPVNRLGVTFFASLLSWIMARRISDPFCGTKVFLRKYWQHFEMTEFLWGDWDLFFTAARFRMKMVELPVHYKTRKAGESKMRPIEHGLKLLKASLKGLKVVK